MRVIGILLIATTVVNALSSTTTNIDNTDVSNNNGVVGLDEVNSRLTGKELYMSIISFLSLSLV